MINRMEEKEKEFLNSNSKLLFHISKDYLRTLRTLVFEKLS
jgi:hypothetical protein